MKYISSSFLICLCVFLTIINTQTNPSAVSATKAWAVSGTTGLSVYGVFAGRTPCQEFLKEFDLGVRPACTKRKMGLILYEDSVTHQPTIYETRGMDKWSGKGRWHIIQGTATDPQAIVFKLDLDANTFLYLLKGDENVLFILDKNKNFLIGNANHSYTLNRKGNKIPWDQRLYLINKGSSE